MKVSVAALQEMVRKIVREEVARAIRETLPEALSRSYIREIVAESTAQARPSPAARPARAGDPRTSRSIVSELVRKHGVLDDMDDDDEDLPQTSNPLLERSNPLSMIYEGTSPLPEDNARQPGDFDVDLREVGFADSNVLKRMAGL